MSDTLPRHFDLWQSSLNWQPTEAQQALFQQLYEQILIGNKQLNLTRITAPDDFWEKHLWDSLSGVAPWLGDLSEQNTEPGEDQTDQAEGTDSIVSVNAGSTSAEAESDEPIRIVDIGTGGRVPRCACGDRPLPRTLSRQAR